MIIIIIIGENNVNYDRDKYNCTFPKMIEAWRNIWHIRTDSITNPYFPFGFVQVTEFLLFNFLFFNYFFLSYLQMIQQVKLLEDFLGFVGIKHLILVMFLIMLYQMFSWQLL